MKCPRCGTAELIQDTRDIPYNHHGKSITIPAVTGQHCPACGECICERQELERCIAAMRTVSDDLASTHQ